MEYRRIMIIGGIDPGYDRAGYGFIKINNQHKYEVLAYGLVSTPKNKSFCERIFELGNDIEHLLQTYKPDHLFIEQLFIGKNTKTVLKVAEVRGLLRYLAQKQNIPLSELAPTSIKKIVSGYGAADKVQMIRAITLLLNLSEPPYPDDVADALSIAFCGYIKYS